MNETTNDVSEPNLQPHSFQDLCDVGHEDYFKPGRTKCERTNSDIAPKALNICRVGRP